MFSRWAEAVGPKPIAKRIQSLTLRNLRLCFAWIGKVWCVIAMAPSSRCPGSTRCRREMRARGYGWIYDLLGKLARTPPVTNWYESRLVIVAKSMCTSRFLILVLCHHQVRSNEQGSWPTARKLRRGFRAELIMSRLGGALFIDLLAEMSRIISHTCSRFFAE